MDREQARDKIKQSIKCTDYLEKSKGNNMYCCPICNSGHGQNKTGAVKYYPETNTWHCHACNNGGDVIDAYKAQQGCDYNEALTRLAAQIGITIIKGTERPQNGIKGQGNKYPDEQEKSAQNAKQSATGQPADYNRYYENCRARLDDPAAISYLQARGISKETAEAYKIGYDPQADPAGAPGAADNEYKAHPTPRIIAPCTKDFYIARSIDPNTPAAFKAPNPKGSSTKLFNAAALYSDAKVVFVTEGIFDALSLLEAGHAAIALNGKGNGKLLTEKLQEKPTRATIIICPDNDDDPETAADTEKRAQQLNNDLHRQNVKSIIFNIAGDEHDANDALQADREQFTQNIAAAIREAGRDDLTNFLEKVKTEAYKPHKTGLPFFDNLLDGGIISQSLLLLIAAPNTGKTTICQQIAETMAANKDPVIYFNFEMSTEQMLAKAISAKYYKGNGGDKSTIEMLQGYKWTPEDEQGITRTIEAYRRENYPYIKYNPAGISSDLDALLDYLDATGAAAEKRGERAPAAVIDYLHLIKTREKIEDTELIKQTVTGLKRYAIKYNTFVIGIIAANRDSTKNGRLTLESGRDSSNLEYTADYQISLNYEDIDSGTIKPDHTDEIEQLKREQPRRMILRLLKARLTGIQSAAHVLFDTKHNIFYGTTNTFETAEDAPPFYENQTTLTI